MKTQIKKLLTHCLILASAFLIAGCASTGNNFNDSNISQIKKGQTTEADLVQMFGQPQNRTINSEGVATLTWMYVESAVTGQSFIPYAGAFMGGERSKSKTLTVTLAEDKVTDYSYSGGGMESRGMTQSAPKN